MKLINILPLAVLSSAFVLPPEQVLDELVIADNHRKSWYDEAVSTKDDVLSSVKDRFGKLSEASENAWNTAYESVKPVKNALDQAFDSANNAANGLAEDFESWFDDEQFEGPPHHGPPDHGPPEHGGPPPHHGPPEHGRPKRPHHPPHKCKPNMTVYQLIAKSKYTTKLANLISEYDDLVENLNSTKANYTVFAPTDKAFDKVPEHVKPSKEWLKALLQYHVVPEFYPAGRVLASHTAPTLLKSEHLGSEPLPQRLAFKLSLRGLTVNWFSRVVAINIFATNGVIHGVDSLIIPPPSVVKVIDLFPGDFSTLELGLSKTGLLDALNSTHHAGGTFFAPSNFAFKKMGPKINAFLFSQYGLKYLKALLEYHVVPDNTLYSDAYYKADASEPKTENFPKGKFHLDLPTLLKDRTLAIDISRFGRFIGIKINGFSSVAVQDGIAEDGVIHVVRNVLIPPKKLGGSEEEDHWDGGEIEVEDLKERLEPFVSSKNDL